MNNQHLSNGNTNNSANTTIEFNVRRKIASACNRLIFLKKCINEKVLPNSAPPHLRNDDMPFTKAARAYLEEACSNLRNQLTLKREDLKGVKLNAQQTECLKKFNTQQQQKLDRKLDSLCRNSKWTSAGRTDLINNMSKRNLTIYEKEALSLGLKFSSGKDQRDLADHVINNYRFGDKEADKGFIQGVLTCCKALADSEPSTLPKRYLIALEGLAKDETIVITSADKGGGIIILDRQNYEEKMECLLSDKQTYSKKRNGFIKTQGVNFNKKARKILKKSERGRTLQYLLEQDPKAPKMRGIPKVHKEGVPMRPITSGIGSAPHRIAKILAKPLTKLLGSISNSHLKNSGDLLDRLKQLDFSHKKMASFDVTALFTNVPVQGAMKAIEMAIKDIPTEELPIPKPHFLQLVELCLDFQAFSYNDKEFAQVDGLAMGSPLSPVAACLYMELLERDNFKEIMGEDSIWLRYVDDVFVLVPEGTNLEDKLKKLNEVEKRIQFTLETETERTLSFLDILIMRREDAVKFKVFRKKTNREDYIHYFSAHNERVKSGVIIGFFLRAYRICSSEYLEDEVKHIFESFMRLKYPKAFIIKCMQKAKKIRRTPTSQQPKKDQRRIIVVPGSGKAQVISRALKKAGVQLVEKTGPKIGEMIKKRREAKTEDSVVYKVPCSQCPRAYYGETYRGIKKRVGEHKADIRHHRDTSSFVMHIEKYQHLPDWGKTEIIWKGREKAKRKIIESAVIETMPNINSKRGDFNLSPILASVLWDDHINVTRGQQI